MNRYPAKPVADQLASQGRHGDSVLVHMSPDEVQGIASLSPGSMTINPVTGLPEAFNFKKALKIGLPIAASIAMPALLPAMAPALAGGLGSGLATAALTGDIKRGLVSGVMGAGIGAAAGAAGGNAAEAAMAAQGGAGGAGSIGQQAVASSVLGSAPSAATQAIATPSFSVAGGTGLLPNTAAMGAQAAPSLGVTGPFQSGSGFAGEMMKSSRMVPAMMGYGQLAQMDADDAWAKEAEGLAGDRRAKQDQSYGDIQAAYRGANPSLSTGPSPYRNQMNPDLPGMWRPGMAMGGRTSTAYTEYGNDAKDRRDRYSGVGIGGPADGPGAIDPVSVQMGLRGKHSVAPPEGFMPGFNPEFNYFQDDPENIQAPPATGPSDWTQMYAGGPGAKAVGMPGSPIPGQPYFDNVLPPNKPGSEDKPKGMAEGGLAGLPPAGGGQPDQKDMQMLTMALLGGAEGSDQIVNMFIQKYGQEAFQAARQMILQQGNPGAQTEGMISGPGGGMDDQVPGMIGNQQEVAVSPGEYIVPADVVSGLGDGSSDAGANELDGMMNNVRRARQGGRMDQPAAINAQRMMPRV